MELVHRAHDPEIDRRVAIKLVRADLLEDRDRDDFLARFRREAQAAARCGHPNIVAVYGYALHDGQPFITMARHAPSVAARPGTTIDRSIH